MKARDNIEGSTRGPGPEKLFEAKVMLSLGVFFPKDHHIWKHHGTEFTPPGTPDLIGHIRGVFTGLELKVWPGRPSQHQVDKILSYARTSKGKCICGILTEYEGTALFIPPSLLADGYSGRQRETWLPLANVNWTQPSTQKKFPVIDLRPLLTLDMSP